jgi:glycerol-3-phosphate acyltransferase PlsY
MQVNEALLHNWFYGNFAVRVVFALGFSFLMGTIPFGRVVDWLFAGSESARTGSYRRAGRFARMLLDGLDALKAFIPVAIVAHGGGLILGLFAAIAVSIGHLFSPWLRGRGPGDRAMPGVMGGIALGLIPALLTFLRSPRVG